jgi:hypothetical protein
MTSFNAVFFNAAPAGTIQEHNLRQVCTNLGHQAAWAIKFVWLCLILWVFKMELASCHPAGSWKFEAVFRFLEICGLLM